MSTTTGWILLACIKTRRYSLVGPRMAFRMAKRCHVGPRTDMGLEGTVMSSESGPTVLLGVRSRKRRIRAGHLNKSTYICSSLRGALLYEESV